MLLLEAGRGDFKNKFIRVPAGILRLFKRWVCFFFWYNWIEHFYRVLSSMPFGMLTKTPITTPLTTPLTNVFLSFPTPPLFLFRCFFNYSSVYDWGYESSSETSLSGRNVFLARGKVLGGSSCTNVLLHHRGSEEDYDGWGVDGWRGRDVLGAFKGSQDDRTVGKDERFHGKGGEVSEEG